MKDPYAALKKARERREAKSQHPQPVLIPTTKTKLPLKLRLMSPIITGILRHLITTAGGTLVAQGTLSDSDINLVVGALMAIGGVAWSVWSKKKEQAK